MRPLLVPFALLATWLCLPAQAHAAQVAPHQPDVPSPYTPQPYAPPGRFATPPPGEPDAPRPVLERADDTQKESENPYAPRRSPRRRHPDAIPMGWLMPIGLNLGGVLRGDQGKSGFLIGAEASVVKFPIKDGFWAGGYTDALYDHAQEQVRFSAGPELGWALLGLDAGVFGSLGNRGSGWGLMARGFLTVGVLSAYVRYGVPVVHQDRDPRFVEIGALLKVPITLKDQDD